MTTLRHDFADGLQCEFRDMASFSLDGLVSPPSAGYAQHELEPLNKRRKRLRSILDTSTTVGTTRPIRLFACPFSKAFPDDNDLDRLCCRRGRPTFHRVKEHLLRKHCDPKDQRPLISPDSKSKGECDEKTRREIPEHLKLNDGCRKALGSKNKPTPDTKKWTDVYSLLFPDQETIPSPYVDQDDVVNLLNAFVSFVERALRLLVPVCPRCQGTGKETKDIFLGTLRTLVPQFQQEERPDPSAQEELFPFSATDGSHFKNVAQVNTGLWKVEVPVFHNGFPFSDSGSSWEMPAPNPGWLLPWDAPGPLDSQSHAAPSPQPLLEPVPGAHESTGSASHSVTLVSAAATNCRTNVPTDSKPLHNHNAGEVICSATEASGLASVNHLPAYEFELHQMFSGIIAQSPLEHQRPCQIGSPRSVDSAYCSIPSVSPSDGQMLCWNGIQIQHPGPVDFPPGSLVCK
ncbi:hypothetical protein QBC37DRAFT_82311 [Rhypophila decipiens]|uniref:Uncharacterized protein n=1 Tax=Rhypophila decipiens TaxID=261697 RepID=A0AAN6Y0W1_9PEZI|nr:hypothetical protein QBC37DRAFT_82311 [Rhypophila decipiens]